MENLLILLKILERDDTIYNHSIYLSHYIPIVRQISELATTLLFTKDGECNWDNIEYLKTKKYKVNPIESMTFGWLIGGIYTKKGVITYG